MTEMNKICANCEHYRIGKGHMDPAYGACCYDRTRAYCIPWYTMGCKHFAPGHKEGERHRFIEDVGFYDGRNEGEIPIFREDGQ